MPFKRCTPNELRLASGESKRDFSTLSLVKQSAFSTRVSGFQKIPLPKPGDWLSERKEDGQSVNSFNRRSVKNWIRDVDKDEILLQPIGQYDEDVDAPALTSLAQFLSCFLQCKVRIASTVPIESVNKTGFVYNPSSMTHQLLCSDAFDFLLSRTYRKSISRHTVAVVAVTMQDITPGEEWNYVFGQARAFDGVGIFSFARYHPHFYNDDTADIKLSDIQKDAILQKACKTLAHETGHIVGMKHCIYYHCLMNGNNGGENVPMELCPICLQKLCLANHSIDVVERYKQLSQLYTQWEWTTQAVFANRRYEMLSTIVNPTDSTVGDTHGVISGSGQKSDDKAGNDSRNDREGQPLHAISVDHRYQLDTKAISHMKSSSLPTYKATKAENPLQELQYCVDVPKNQTSNGDSQANKAKRSATKDNRAVLKIKTIALGLSGRKA